MENNNEFRDLNYESQADRFMEAWIMWAKTALDLSDIIDTLYKQSMNLNDSKQMKQVILNAYKEKKQVVTNESIQAMKKFISQNILIDKGNE